MKKGNEDNMGLKSSTSDSEAVYSHSLSGVPFPSAALARRSSSNLIWLLTVEEEADPDTIGDSANTTETQVSSESESRTPPVHGNSEKMVEFGKPRTKDHALLDDLNLALNPQPG